MLCSFDCLDFLQEEGSNYSALDTFSAKSTSIRSRHTLVFFSKTLVVIWPKLCNTVDSLPTFTTVIGGAWPVPSFLNILDNNFGAGSPDFSDFIAGGVVAKSSSVCYSLHHIWL